MDNKLSNNGRLFAVTFLFALNACTSFRYPGIKKELVARQVDKNQVAVIKGTILDAGYYRVGREDFRWQGAICTNYAKQLPVDGIKNEVEILLSFKKAENDSYRNLGLSVQGGRREIPEVNAEVERMESALYGKLVELTDPQNVKRGEREIYRSSEPASWKYYGKQQP